LSYQFNKNKANSNNMKKSIVLLALFSLISLSAQAQKTATWKGGTPGRTTDWNCPTNWEESRVPNEFSDVVIPDVSTSTFSYPVIKQGIVEIASLQCASNARLTTLGDARVIFLDDASTTAECRQDVYARATSAVEPTIIVMNRTK
jgi:hypothetical protein